MKPDQLTAAQDTLYDWVEVAARRALWAELSLFPKPGLVSPVDNGSHQDMTMSTLIRSIHGLRSAFGRLALLGQAIPCYAELQRLAITAEFAMLSETGQINTHRGALFCMGLIAASYGVLRVGGQRISASLLSATISQHWGQDILRSQAVAGRSHGANAVAQYRLKGARQEAAEGFPTLFSKVIPCFVTMQVLDVPKELALIQAFFTAMAHLDDTNVVHRGGIEALGFVKNSAAEFLDRGGVLKDDWQGHAITLHDRFVARRLSPGGSADMISAAYFVQALL